MRVRICPYCDHEMKRRYRCDTCGAFVWNANFLDVPKTDDDPMMDMTRFGRAPEPVKKAYKEYTGRMCSLNRNIHIHPRHQNRKSEEDIIWRDICWSYGLLVILVISAAVLILSNEKGCSQNILHMGAPVEVQWRRQRQSIGIFLAAVPRESAGGLDYPAPEGSEYITQEAADATGKACNSRAHF